MTMTMWQLLRVIDPSALATEPPLLARVHESRRSGMQNGPVGILSGLMVLAGMLGEVVGRPLVRFRRRRIAVWETVLRKMTPDGVRRAPLFQDLSWRQARRVVCLGSLKAFDAGQYAARKGEAGTAMYMVISGQLRVFDRAADGRERTLAFVGPGMVSGAVDLVGAGVRMAHVVAELPSHVLVLDHQALERIWRRFPFTGATLFRNVAATLSESLRITFEALMQIGSPVSLDQPVDASASAGRPRAVVPRDRGFGWGESRPMTRVGVERKKTSPPSPRGCRAWVRGARRRQGPGRPLWLSAGPHRTRGGQGCPSPRREPGPIAWRDSRASPLVPSGP